MRLYGKDWNLIQTYIGSRSSAQIRSHAQKYFSKLFKAGKLDVLEVFDNLLSSNRRPDEDQAGDGVESEKVKTLPKTKTITKNYGTRLGKPVKKVS